MSKVLNWNKSLRLIYYIIVQSNLIPFLFIPFQQSRREVSQKYQNITLVPYALLFMLLCLLIDYIIDYYYHNSSTAGTLSVKLISGWGCVFAPDQAVRS